MTRDRGTAAIEMMLGFILLMLPAAALVMAVTRWPEARSVAESTASRAATTYATAESEADGRQRAAALVADTAAGTGESMTVAFVGTWCRGCDVSVTVSVQVPAFAFYGIGSTANFDYDATGHARVEDYRGRP